MNRLSPSRLVLPLLLATLVVLPSAFAQESEEAHVGYYYPEPATIEYYPPRAPTIPDATPGLRIGFVTGVATQAKDRAYPPRMAMFAKGENFQKLIIVALQDGPLDTIYRARGILANLTASARLLPVFDDLGVDERLTFFDLANMMGFTQLTISDGKTYAHQIVFNEKPKQ